MTHMHIPTLPPPRHNPRPRAKHRADAFADPNRNRARCSHFGKAKCGDPMCPRHKPVSYASYAAKHDRDIYLPEKVQ